MVVKSPYTGTKNGKLNTVADLTFILPRYYVRAFLLHLLWHKTTKS